MIRFLIDKTTDCPSSPSGLICLTHKECNRCTRTQITAGQDENCVLSSDKPVCDIDESTDAIETSDDGSRKLAVCKGCKKAGKFEILWRESFLIDDF